MSQPMIALQMNPLSSIAIETDTTFALGLEGQNRGYRLFAYAPESLSYAAGKVMARGHWVTLRDQSRDFYSLGAEQLLDLREAAFVLMRQNPPFNMAYIAATHLLELLPPTTRVLNDPAGVRNAPEKLLVTSFPELMPPTLMTWDALLIEEFRATHGAVILKPLFEFGGGRHFSSAARRSKPGGHAGGLSPTLSGAAYYPAVFARGCPRGQADHFD